MKDRPELARFTSSSMAELSDAIFAGDAIAFEEFYRRYAPRVYGLLMVLTNARHDLASDLLQTVMLRAARKFQRTVSEEAGWAWLATIARNAVVDHIRTETRRRGREETSAEIVRLERLAEAAGPSAQMIAALEAAIRELAPEQRSLIRQFYFEAVPQIAIAQSNNTTVKAVQSRLARIRQQLKRTLIQILDNENER